MKWGFWNCRLPFLDWLLPTVTGYNWLFLVKVDIMNSNQEERIEELSDDATAPITWLSFELYELHSASSTDLFFELREKYDYKEHKRGQLATEKKMCGYE
jgi:hypothetical protein